MMLLSEFLSDNSLSSVATSELPKHYSTMTSIEDHIVPHMADGSLTVIEEKNAETWPLKIPLASKNAILCTSTEFILLNEASKKKNNLILIDANQNKVVIRSPIKATILQVIWAEHYDMFMILTEKEVWSLTMTNKTVQMVKEIVPKNNTPFKTMALINLSILILGYDEWHTKMLDRWIYDDNIKQWSTMEPLPLLLTANEYMGKMTIDQKGNGSDEYLILPIYNDFTGKWRIEFFGTEKFNCLKTISLKNVDAEQDLKVVAIHNENSQVDWLVYSSNQKTLVGITEDWNIISLKYLTPIQEIGIFLQKYLVFRSNSKVEVHLLV